MSSRYEHIVERLGAIEEELRDLAFEHVRAAVREGDPEEAERITREEKQLLKARRAIAKAITELSSGRGLDD